MIAKQDAAGRMGTEPVGKLLVRFSLPAIAGMMVSALYNFVDRIFVGQAVNEVALGGLSLVMPIMMIMFSFAMLFGAGTANMLSMRLGQGRKEEAENAFNHCVFLLLGIGIVVTILGLVFLEPILSLMGAPPGSEALDYARIYLRITLYGSVFQAITFGLAQCTRAQGFPVVTMIAMLLAAVLNIIFDALFILVFKWGVEGAAWATIVSQVISMAWILRFNLGKTAIIRINLKVFKPSLGIVLQIVAFGLSPFLMQFVMSGVSLLLNVSMGWYGAEALGVANGGDIALSGMSINGSIIMLIFMPIFGINQGAQPILGYNYGARQYQRVLRAYIGAVIAATAICIVGFAVVQLFPAYLVELFVTGGSPALMEFTPKAMRIMSMLLPLAGFQIISANFFVVTGRPKISIFLSLLRQCIALIPCMFVFGRIWGLWGVIAATPVADGVSFIMTATMIFFEMQKLRRSNPNTNTIPSEVKP
jgi:putative MATE family efflux protein